MGTKEVTDYGQRTYKVYPITESELNEIMLWAALSLLIVPLPFAAFVIISHVLRLKKQTSFDSGCG